MALAARIDESRDQDEDGRRESDVVLGDDWIAPHANVEQELRDSRERRGLFSLNRSPLTRKIITFNLIALNIMVVGILFLNGSRGMLEVERINAAQAEIELVADVIEARIPPGAEVGLAPGEGLDLDAILGGINLRDGTELFVFDARSALVGEKTGQMHPAEGPGAGEEAQPTVISDLVSGAWHAVSGSLDILSRGAPPTREERVLRLIEEGDPAETRVVRSATREGETAFTALSPIMQEGRVLGIVASVASAAEVDAAVRLERERVLQMFMIATLASIGFSLVLASTIAHPISDLAEAAEIGRDRNRSRAHKGRIRIPDLTARPDEIGRLSGAIRGMVAALYDRIDGNEQFAADVAHEIKNPLASLRSAVGSLRMVRKEDHRQKLLDVIEHDVRRLDRLVSDISNASRLDSELVKEEEQEFDLLGMIDNLAQFLGEDAKKKGVEFITDLPPQPIRIQGLEARLAQVFVNLITNAISFCEDGDAIRVWARRRDNRVLVVVEDTGPGIPNEALTKIFKRFYSQRPESDFGNNSGLGLAISKQIVEAHGGVIWVENIRPTEADVTSEPLGARFVVGLPL
ncbi:sensor histidine kinase [Roseivivax halodurans JCM 10272]|uniref:histidine kinase n=1 Tax=Roseivivax halodurans JCM 10272 TaxID=1449350 RepID=X7EFT9_9RHOB|nr:ATP-binding protein [Roseivivax halodurans]ETX13958.1 sensor histidine kinase [Roseivivax halodurans JCM 10272]